MYPILIDWGPVFLPAWHVLFVLGAIAAYFYMLKMRSAVAPEITEGQLAGLYVAGYVGGYFGARLLTIVVNERATVDSFGALISQLFTFGAMTFYGGLIGTAMFATIYALVRTLNPWALLDLCVPAGILGLAVGRIGCFLNGDDFGRPTELQGASAPWWSVTFPNLQDGVARVPVQLIEAAVALAIVVICVSLTKQRRLRWRRGQIGLFALLTYAASRFFLEFLRGDGDRGYIAIEWLSTSQFISLLIILISFLLISRRT